ncbi:MAG: ABC transporter ATP-binding protein [Mycoplasma sp.]|nr:ABC transporter ATP-binding protein [Mycoplasma sp.]
MRIRELKTHHQKLPILELSNLVKEYDDHIVLKNINLEIKQGEFVTILGPSGSGKTTLLRLIAGFEWVTRGEIKFKGVDMKDLYAYQRPTRTIFQDYALFPHLNVLENIKYGLKLKKVPFSNPDPNKVKKLKLLQEKWKEKAQKKFDSFNKKFASWEKFKKNRTKNSFLYRYAQNRIDELDFHYSYWENYILLKTQKYENRHLNRSLTSDEIHQKSLEIIKLIGLTNKENNHIDSLSGGMKQRVALARSLIIEPEILLLDEPLSALDLKVRETLQIELKKIQKKMNLTFILVTHDQEEALKLSDRIIVMKEGEIMQIGKPNEIYDTPKNKWIANFIGQSNILDGIVSKKNRVKFFDHIFDCDTYEFVKNDLVHVMLRPEDFVISKQRGNIKGKILEAYYHGLMYEYIIFVLDKYKIVVQSTKKFFVNMEIFLDWDEDDVHVMKVEENE